MDASNKIGTLGYFGTSLDMTGHYFWKLEGNYMKETRDVWFSDIPFDPEHLIANCENGTVKYLRSEDYAICAIEGSCCDKRSGSHSIFWTKEPIRLGEFKNTIMSIPAAKKIIDQMPFEVKWNTLID